MTGQDMNTIRSHSRSGWMAVPLLAAIVAGCSPQGAGTIEVSKPEAIQAKAGGTDGTIRPKTEKQAKALQIEEEAAKKKPKLR